MDEPRSAGRYTILGRIAAGGMGEVYRAKMSTGADLEKTVALKVVRKDLVQGAEVEELFVDEARLAMRLSHANIVHSFDVGRIDKRWFIAMELVEGLDLGQVRARCMKQNGGPVPVKHVLTVGVEALKGLDYAHRRTDESRESLGIVHRDISPGNILVSHEGEVKIADFGVAAGTHRKGRTQDGAIKGKIAYMAPEQLRGERLDARADLYAVGVVLFELLSGRRPFVGDTPISLIPDIVDGRRPTLPDVAPDVPLDLCAIVDRALAVDRRGRFPNAAAMRQELERFALSEGLLLSTADLADFVSDLSTDETIPDTPPEAGTKPGVGGTVENPTTPAKVGVFDLRLGEELRRVDTDEPVSIFSTKPRLAAPAEPEQPVTTGVTPQLPTTKGAPVALVLVALAILVGGGTALASYVWGIQARPRSTAGEGELIAAAAEPDASVSSAGQSLVHVVEDALPDASVGTIEVDASAVVVEPRPRPINRPPTKAPEPLPTADATLSIASDPWANVYIDGHLVGRTTLRGHTVRAGSHTIRLHNPAAGLERTLSVNLEPGQAARYSINLAEP